MTVNGVLDLNGTDATVGNLNGSGTITSVAGGTPLLKIGGAGGVGTFSGSIAARSS